MLLSGLLFAGRCILPDPSSGLFTYFEPKDEWFHPKVPGWQKKIKYEETENYQVTEMFINKEEPRCGIRSRVSAAGACCFYYK